MGERPHRIIGELRAARIRQGLSLRHVAAQLGYARNTVGNWEAGIRRPGAGQVEAYAAVLGYELILRERP